MSSKISRRYAKALLSLGQEDGTYEACGRDLQEFTDFCETHQEYFQVISNPLFALGDRKRILEAVLAKSAFSPLVQNFLKLLLDKDRVGSIKEITEHYTQLTDEISDVTRAKITSARPLKKQAADKLEKALEDLTSRKVKMEMQEDESLIGGVIVKIGDLVLDGSVRAQLEGLRESLKRGEYS
jgi:F-type H+-transporting ATPase subunit delta